MKTKVNFIESNDLEKLKKIIIKRLKNKFKENNKIAIKLHMGELKNKTFLSNKFAKIVAEACKELNLKPFLFDSPVCYGGGRGNEKDYLKTAAVHGFTEESIGCPIIISNKNKEIKTEHMTIEVCTDLLEADGVIALTHVKGHPCSGVGASIKNFGMGGVSIKTKRDIHNGGQPLLDKKKCTGCGICSKNCFEGAVKIIDGKANYDYEACWGCGICIENCPSNCLKPRIAKFETLLAEGAAALVRNQKNILYINVMQNITKWCDCASDAQGIVSEDVGILVGEDIVAIDKVAIDLINKKNSKNLFLEANKKDPYSHIKEAEKLSIGKQNYTIENS